MLGRRKSMWCLSCSVLTCFQDWEAEEWEPPKVCHCCSTYPDLWVWCLLLVFVCSLLCSSFCLRRSFAAGTCCTSLFWVEGAWWRWWAPWCVTLVWCHQSKDGRDCFFLGCTGVVVVMWLMCVQTRFWAEKWHFWRWLAWWKKLLFPAEWDQLISVSSDLPVEHRLPGYTLHLPWPEPAVNLLGQKSLFCYKGRNRHLWFYLFKYVFLKWK